MSAHFLMITLGPVQEFILQARRTRDLWYGSHLLSELARSAARALVDGGAELVFPALRKGDPELEPCLAPLRADGQSPLSIANKLVAVVPLGVDPARLAREVRARVLAHWRDEVAAPVMFRCRGLLAPGTDEVWNEQVGTLMEFLAGWAPINDYAEARSKVEKAISGRKNLRDFGPWRHYRGGVPKSSLDGARETVLSEPGRRNSQLVRKYRIADGEQLDAVGLVKRAGGEPDQFVPIVNVALATWIQKAESVAPGELENLKEACHEAGIPPVSRKDLPCARPFPFDAGVLLPSRWPEIFSERDLSGDPQAWGSAHVRPLLRKLSEPYPYVACLVADGDRVGRTLDGVYEVDGHRRISTALAEFSKSARATVEQVHCGTLIYAGGDDVLAFLPLSEALACADQLRLDFEKHLKSACESLPAGSLPTLSVGLGIGHVMESMADLLDLGREAERKAKVKRNSLAVLVDMRSGGKRVWWDTWNRQPVDALKLSVEDLAQRIPTRKVYEVASILRRFPRSASESQWSRVLLLEVKRSLSRSGDGALRPDQVGLHVHEGMEYTELRTAVDQWVSRVIIARSFSRAVPSERTRNTGETAA